MKEQQLRDRSGNLIGRRLEKHGKIEGRDKQGNLRGTYDPKKDETRDRYGKLVGKGDLLAILIIEPRR